MAMKSLRHDTKVRHAHDNTVNYSKKIPMDNEISNNHHQDRYIASHIGFNLSIRIAILLIYTGSSLPQWFDSFLLTASSSSTLVDWFIFVSDAPLRHLPKNIKMIRMTISELSSRINMIPFVNKSDLNPNNYIELILQTSSRNEMNHNHIIDIEKLLEGFPYVLVEFKPCLGYLFHDYISSYSHWAYADIDQLFGRFDSLISIDILEKYDIYTTSFGDSYRLYMRGQLTIHKNNHYINTLWKDCPYFIDLYQRLDSYRSSNYRSWSFESAEACYSRVVADKNDLKILITATQISDAFSAPLGLI
jgi:hypothetical protein